MYFEMVRECNWRVLFWQWMKTSPTIQKQGKLLLLPATGRQRRTRISHFLCSLLTAMTMESLVDWAFVAAWVEIALAARSGTDVAFWLQHPAFLDASRTAQQQSPSARSPGLWQYTLGLLAEGCSQWSETDARGLKIWFGFKLNTFHWPIS